MIKNITSTINTLIRVHPHGRVRVLRKTQNESLENITICYGYVISVSDLPNRNRFANHPHKFFVRVTMFDVCVKSVVIFRTSGSIINFISDQSKWTCYCKSCYRKTLR
jgi:hypothetical protein